MARHLELLFVICLCLSFISCVPLQVTTDKGIIQGIAENGVVSFLGVPFAKPPIGPLRWQPPQPHDSWSGVKVTTTYGPSCIQTNETWLRFPSNMTFSEDCLYLNVWTSNTTNTAKSVLFWIHGGGLINGGGAAADIRGYQMSKLSDVVVVNINYRLGVLGWLAHPGFATDNPDHHTTGNYGLLDQRMALSWVQTNIHLFGGDPKSITILGESAGGSSVCFHMVSPNSKGLFSKAVIESGACFSEIISLKQAEQIAIGFQNQFGCTGSVSTILQCLRAIPSKNILQAQNALNYASTAVIDGMEFIEHPYATFRRGGSVQVPLIAGNVLNEGTIFVNLPRPVSPNAYSKYIITNFASFAPLVMEQYPCANYNASDCWYALTEITGDFLLGCPTQYIADSLASSHTVFTYVFSHWPLWTQKIIPQELVFHSTEILFVFSTLMDNEPYSPPEVTLANQMTAYWTNFAKTGNPTSQNTPVTWPVYSSPNNRLNLNTTISVINSYHQKECTFWANFYSIAFNA